MSLRVLFLINSLSVQGEPMGVMQLAAIARSRGHVVGLSLASGDCLADVEAFEPGLLAASLMSGEYVSMRRAVRAIKAVRPNLPVLMGGAHATFSPETLADSGADAMCVGEGDIPFAAILERLEAGDKDLSGISNLYTGNGRAELAPLITDLDSLPFIDREIIYDASPVLRSFPMRSFYSSRGCPFNCSYCFNHALNRMYKGKGPIVRKRSVDNLLDEIEQVVARYPTQYIRFSDDAFVHRVDPWLEEFADKYPRRVGLPFYCLVRPNCVSPELVDMLARAGCHSVGMSIECGNEGTRRHVLRRSISDDGLVEAFRLFHERGVTVKTNNMLGLPGATVEDEVATLDLNIRCGAECALFGIFVPYPGTRLFDYSVELGAVRPELSLEELNEFTGEASMLDFTDEEKRIQKNFFYLAPLVVRFPSLRNLFVKRLMRMPNNMLFALFHVVVKYYLVKRYIVPVRFSPRDYARYLVSVFMGERTQMRGAGRSKGGRQ